MDIHLLKSDELKVWADFIQGVRLQVRYIGRDEYRQLLDQATTKELIDGELKEKINFALFDSLICQAAVIDFTGIEDQGQPVSYSAEVVALLAAKSGQFVNTVTGICSNLERIMNMAEEDERKNSEGTSRPASTSPASVAKRAGRPKK